MVDYTDREAFVAVDVAKLRNAIAIAATGREGEVRFFGEVDALAATCKRSTSATNVGQTAAARDTRKLRLEPRLHRRDKRSRLSIAQLLALGGGAAADRRFDHIELGDTAQGFGGDWRAGRLVHVIDEMTVLGGQPPPSSCLC